MFELLNQVRICVGHYPNDSYDHPAKLSGANTRMLLEVSLEKRFR